MTLLTPYIRACLIDNGLLRYQASESGEAEPDFYPVVKLFTPDAQCTWLLTELDPCDDDIAFGLCDLGMGTPELGRVSIAELESVRGPLGLAIERDNWFRAEKTISQYAREAREARVIRA